MARLRTLGFQSLENRNLMAGDVAVAVNQGAIAITGDSAANFVEISEVAPNVLRIQGTFGTSINGQSFVDVRSRAFGDVSIDLGAGNDQLRVHDLDLAYHSHQGDWSLNLGSGRNLATFNNVELPQNLLVNVHVPATNGIDTVRIEESNIGGSVLMNLGAGADFVEVSETTIRRDLSINGGADNDIASVGFSEIGGRFSLNMGAGNDMAFVVDNQAGSASFDGGSDTLDPSQSSNFNRDVLLYWNFVLDSNIDAPAVSTNFEHVYDVDDILFNSDFDGLEDELDDILADLGLE
jgi:hypothetical protein